MGCSPPDFAGKEDMSESLGTSSLHGDVYDESNDTLSESPDTLSSSPTDTLASLEEGTPRSLEEEGSSAWEARTVNVSMERRSLRMGPARLNTQNFMETEIWSSVHEWSNLGESELRELLWERQGIAVGDDCSRDRMILLLGLSRFSKASRQHLTKAPSVETESSEFIYLAVNVGDCKTYLYRRSEGSFQDVTQGNRLEISDPCDPGGRLGPYLENGSPDLRNLAVYSIRARAGDIVIACSDGVHDNLDPEYMGISPRQCNVEADSWDQADPGRAEAAKTAFTKAFLEVLVSSEMQSSGGKEVTPRLIAEAVVRHAVENTKQSRRFMMQYPQRRLPKDYTLYPGKMDHTTVVCFVIGKDRESSKSFATSSHVRSATAPEFPPPSEL